MYEMEWIVGIYKKILVKLVVGWSNSSCKLILAIGSQIWLLEVLTKTRVKSGSLDLQKFKSGHLMEGRRHKKLSIFSIT